MPSMEAPCVELGSAPETPTGTVSPSPSELSSSSSTEPPHPIRTTPLFRALAMPPPGPDQPPGQDELERRLPGYRRIVIPRELTLIELLKQSSGVNTDEEVLRIRDAKLRVVAERVGLRRLNVLAPRLRSLTLDGSALASLRDLGIGLVHLKVLSVNRCNLNSLDGVWGLGALRELSAAGNRLRDLQPLAALQKLHTLNLSDNPITDSGRIWTLGVCGSLRRLTLRGTPASESQSYRSQIAAALPMLVYLDERPLHNDIDYDSEGLFGVLSWESEHSDVEEFPKEDLPPPAEPEPGPSTIEESRSCSLEGCTGDDGEGIPSLPLDEAPARARPATSACAGPRPPRPALPPRPRTAQPRPALHEAPTRLQILNTLMDEEWRCSGSNLTSQGTVCGNITRALRRPASSAVYRLRRDEARRNEEREQIQNTLQEATKSLAAEIPKAPRVEDWLKFKEETGIDIDIDFTQRPGCSDPSKAIERLEQIEKETRERFKNGNQGKDMFPPPPLHVPSFMDIMNEFDTWKLDITPDEPRDVYSLFSNLADVSVEKNESLPNLDSDESLSE